MSRVTNCPVCGSRSITGFLRRERVPVHQNLVIDDQESAVKIARGDLDLVFCEECGFVFNRAFDLSKLSYREDYDNTQTCSSAFNKYVNDLVEYLISERGIRDCRVVEVGSGKGTFLRKLVEAEESGNSGYGFDPAYAGPAVDLEGRLRFEKRFYGPESAGIPADVVVCRHVIEHVPKPVELLRAIRQALVSSPHARVFFETPDVTWILRNQVIWDFFYEHCSLFTPESLTTAFETAGFAVESVRNVFGGQYLWLEAVVSNEVPAVTKSSGAIPQLAEQFAASERELRREWEARTRELAAEERVALWGAGAKGVTLANLVDSERKWIDCIVDLNPQKQGHYLPGTGHPIVGYQELESRGVTVAILMNPNYHSENLDLLREANIDTRLVQRV